MEATSYDRERFERWNRIFELQVILVSTLSLPAYPNRSSHLIYLPPHVF